MRAYQLHSVNDGKSIDEQIPRGSGSNGFEELYDEADPSGSTIEPFLAPAHAARVLQGGSGSGVTINAAGAANAYPPHQRATTPGMVHAGIPPTAEIYPVNNW